MAKKFIKTCVVSFFKLKVDGDGDVDVDVDVDGDVEGISP